MQQTQDESPRIKCTPQAAEFKAIMLDAIMASGKQKKEVAYDLGYQSDDMSHWLSLHCPSSMPSHLIPAFCRIVGNRMVLEHVLGEVSR